MALNIANTVDNARQIIKLWRQSGASIALVPTMGNLHAGHYKLIATAQQQSKRVIVSIFINPTQFAANEDFATYPRTLTKDKIGLEQMGIDLLFLPTIKEMYPQGTTTLIVVKGLADIYCGRTRPSYFSGVVTIVGKLFNIVQPDVAFFGEKDLQQLMIIRSMVRDLNLPIKIASIATVREHDGLAMSSRNFYLTKQQRQTAPTLYKSLLVVCWEIKNKSNNFKQIINVQLEYLRRQGFKPDYLAICRRSDLKPANAKDKNLVILVAAKLGNARLIDNMSFDNVDL